MSMPHRKQSATGSPELAAVRGFASGKTQQSHGLLGLVLGVLAAVCPSSARADFSGRYFIYASFQCPYYLLEDGEWDLEFRPEHRQFKPCYGLHVVAKQPGVFGDSYCGEDYTAADGSVRIRATTDCDGDVFLTAEASSVEGFRIGTHDFPWWRVPLDAWAAYLTVGLVIPGEVYDFLVANKTFEWQSPSMTVHAGTGDRIHFGDFAIGDSDDHHSSMAADVFPLTSLAIKQLQPSGHLPDDLAVTINHPLVGSPTTIWDTVLFKDATARDRNQYRSLIRSMAHEIGHATYNRYHSGRGHWLSDARFYIANHFQCEPLDTLRFAWYEGFADFIESYAYPGALQQRGGLELTEQPRPDPYYHVFRGCYWDRSGLNSFAQLIDRAVDEQDSPACSPSASGFNHEGNVQALLDQIYYGPYRRAFASNWDSSPPIAGMRTRDPHRPGRGQLALVASADRSMRAFSLPSMVDVFRWIEAAGSDSHTARQFLDGQISPWCAGQDIASRYCTSATFESERRFLDADSSLPDVCPLLDPVSESSGTAIGTNVQLRFLDEHLNPVSAIHFGPVPRGQTRQVTVHLVNSGGDAVTVDSLALADQQASLQLVNPPVLPIQLGPNGSTTLTVVFSPVSGDYSTTLAASSSLIEGLSLPGGLARASIDGSTAAPVLAGKIAFLSSRDGSRNIYTINPDGSGLTRLTSTTANDDDPAWSPDASKIVFASNRSGFLQLFSMNSDGSNVVRLTTNPSQNDQPSWSPDGGTIVFRSTRLGFSDLWTIDPSGGHEHRLLSTSGMRSSPSFSPDGRLIAFASNLGIATTDLAGNPQRQLTTFSFDQSPSWSPDGQKIAFARSGIWVMNADGSNPRRLTADNDDSPTWSPDGRSIAFSRAAAPNDEHVYLMDADGGNVRNLTGTGRTFFDQVPNWTRR